MSESEPVPIMEFFTKIAGVTHKNKDGANRQDIIRKHIRKGTSLLLACEPDNPVDHDAVAVYFRQKKLLGHKLHKLGYLPSMRAGDINEMLEANYRYSVIVKEVTGGTRQKKTRGVNLEVKMYEPV